LCEWQKYYYAIAIVGIAIPILIYAYALNVVWMSKQVLFVVLTALFSMTAYVTSLRTLWPEEHQLPTSGSFVEILGMADDVCNVDASRLEHNELQKLICNGDLSVADTLPNYALIIATYYAMFRRHDLSLAEKLLHIVKSRSLKKDEKDAVNVLETAYNAMTTCDVQSVCNTPAVGRVAYFKELVALHFVDAKTAKEMAKRLKCKILKVSRWHKIYIYNTTWQIDYSPDPRLRFIYYATDHAQPLPACQPQP
jgi:hypothetical protein